MRRLLLLLLAGCGAEEPPIREDKDVLVFSGVIRPTAYNEQRTNRGHHFITWKDGNAADMSLIQADISDRKVMEWLLKAGAEPGNNLTEETWDERDNPESRAPDQKVKGALVRFEIWIDGKKHEPRELFRNEADFEFRFGGHAELIPVWKSG